MSESVAVLESRFGDERGIQGMRIREVGDILKRITREREGTIDIDSLPDERNGIPEVLLTPRLENLKILELGRGEEKDLVRSLPESYDYFSKTRRLEVAENSMRVKILQDLANSMAKGTDWEGRIRVVIMNKGRNTLYAFASPDGTIFINQSLINVFDYFDEVAAVIAHEVGHLINNTWRGRWNSRIHRVVDFGVCWLHEFVSDVGTSQFLEKVGLNSSAYSRVARKFKDALGNRRDLEHQAYLLRAAEVEGVHFVEDYDTSNKAYTPLRNEFKREAELTHLEIAYMFAKKGKVDEFAKLLYKLHPWDLREVFEYLDSNLRRWFWVDKKVRKELGRVMQQYISERLRALGLPEGYIKAFFAFESRPFNYFFPDFKDFSELDSIVKALEKMKSGGFIPAIYKDLFGEQADLDPLEIFLEKINEDSLLIFKRFGYIDLYKISNFIKTIVGAFKTKSPEVPEYVLEKLSDFFIKYIERFYINEENEIPEKQVEILLEAIKEAGLPRLGDFAYVRLEKALSKSGYDVFEKVYSEVFGVRLKRHKEDIGVVDGVTPEEFFELYRLDSERLSNLFEGKSEEFVVDYVRRVIKAYEESLESVIPVLVREAERYTKENVWIWAASRNWKFSEEEFREFLLSSGLDLEVVEEIFGMVEFKGIQERFRNIVRFLSKIKFPSSELYLSLLEEYKEKYSELSGMEWIDLLKLTLPVFEVIDGRSPFGIAYYENVDFDRIIELPFIKKIMEEANSFAEGISSWEDLLSRLEFLNQLPGAVREAFYLYFDSSTSILLMDSFRRKVSEFLEGGFGSDLSNVIRFVDKYFPRSFDKDRVLRRLRRLYFLDPGIKVEEKIERYIEEHEQLGVEEVMMIAKFIEDIETFEQFRKRLETIGREKYLSGEKSVDLPAAADLFLSKVLISEPTLIISTIDPDSRKRREVSTQLFELWLYTLFESRVFLNTFVDYDPEHGRIVVPPFISQYFSFRDLVERLHIMNSAQRFYLILKSLLDEGGLLVSDEGRKYLKKLIGRRFGFRRFVRDLLDTAIEYCDKVFISLTIAHMTSNYLFSALDPSSIEFERLGNKRIRHSKAKFKDRDYWERVRDFAEKSTREIVFFGKRYATKPDSILARKAQEANDQYFETLRTIEMLVDQREREMRALLGEIGVERELAQREESVSSEIDLLIRAGENSALIVRAMQLSAQLLDLEEGLRRRLLDTQDRVEGMDKAVFWLNLSKRSTRDPKLREILANRNFRLLGYLGGGSLFTTYEARMIDEEGREKKVVIKMLNPNAAKFVEDAYRESTKVLDKLYQQRKWRNLVRKIRNALDLSYEWCLRDIEDRDYPQLDERFRRIVKAYNEVRGQVLVNVPRDIYISPKVRIEEKAEGITINQFLKREDVPHEYKREVISILLDFFDYQFNAEPVEFEGKMVKVFHSDPHLGNYILRENGDGFVIEVIDRNMYLTLEEEEVEMFKLLREEGAQRKFIERFIDRCLELGGTEEGKRGKVKRRILLDLIVEKTRQMAKGKEDPFVYLQIVLDRLAEEEIRVPLKYRLMLRNIAAMERLRKEWLEYRV